MNTIFILIMVLGGTTTQSGLTTINVEFSTQKACENARLAIEKTHSFDKNVPIKIQGCFSKN